MIWRTPMRFIHALVKTEVNIGALSDTI
eukprot:COSAG05_NODE_21969_length_268_cov_0.609467_1_plen_27_part_01